MSLRKDLKSKPKKERFFPLRFGDAVRLVKDLELKQFDESRVAIRFENIDGEYDFGFPLLDFVPEEELAIYSLASSIDSELARKATVLALTTLIQIPTKSSDSLHDSYFCAYLCNNTNVVLTRIDRTAKVKKYRGDDKLSNARYTGSKTKEVSIKEIII